MTMNKRSELAKILRRLADFVDGRSDEELAPLFQQAASLMQGATIRRKQQNSSKGQKAHESLSEIAAQLRGLHSREDGDALLRKLITNRSALESLARLMQLPVQRDDTVERLREKIVENAIGSRLRSDAIQGVKQTGK